MSPRGGPGSLSTTITNLRDLAPLTEALAARRETIAGFLDSPILQPEIVDVVGKLGESALEADKATRGRQADVGGVLAIMRQLKNPDVQETLAFVFEFETVRFPSAGR